MGDSLTALYLSNPELAGRLRRQSAAEALMKQGADTTPIRAHSQGIARVAQALMGGLELGMIDRENRADQERMRGEEADYLAGRSAPRPAAPAAMPAPGAPSVQPMAASAPPPVTTPIAPPMPSGPALPAGGNQAARPPVADDPTQALANSAARLPAGIPEMPGGYRNADWAAGLPPPSGRMWAGPDSGAPPAATPAAAPAPSPRPDSQPQRPAEDGELARIQAGLRSRNANVVRMAETDLKIYQAQRQQTQEPLVPIRRPDGSTIMVRRSQAEGMVSAAEPEPLVEVRDDTGATRFVPRSQAINMRSAAPVPQPSDREQQWREYEQLEGLRAAGNLTPQQALRHGLLVRALTGQDQVTAGPQGVVVVGPTPLPTLGGPGAGSNTIPLSGNATPGAAPVQPAAPMAQVPVAPAGGNVPGSDASRLPVPNQRPPVQITTPGGRTASYMPAEPSPPPGYQRGADGTTLEPIPGGPQDQTRQPLSEAQGRSNMFGQSMESAQRIIAGVPQPSGAAIAAWRLAPEMPVNLGLSSEDQRYFNAVRQFAAGVLRKETGAAFGAGELADVHSRFFPLPGDSPETVRQKEEARRIAIEAMRAEVPGGFRGAAPAGGRGNIPSPPPGFRVIGQ